MRAPPSPPSLGFHLRVTLSVERAATVDASSDDDVVELPAKVTKKPKVKSIRVKKPTKKEVEASAAKGVRLPTTLIMS